MAQTEASDAKPIPLTEIVMLPTEGRLATRGDIVTEGFTAKGAEPVSTMLPVEGQLTVIVYGAPPGPLATLPTLKVPKTVVPLTIAKLFVTRPAKLPVMEQIVPSGAVAPEPVTSITSPGCPDVTPPPATVKATVRVAACACLGGVATEKIETNSAEVSSSITSDKELTLRVVNSKHATHVFVGLDYLMLDTQTDSGACTRCLVIHPRYGRYSVEMH
jgi:hypothetical protein